MSLNHQPEASFEILNVAHAHGFAHQPGDAVSPFVVQTLDNAGSAAAFVAGAMLPGRKPFGVSFIEVAVDQFAAIIRRQQKPQALQALHAAIADVKANDLPRQARDGQPQVAVAPLTAKADHQLVDFQGITFERRQQRLGKVQTGLGRLF